MCVSPADEPLPNGIERQPMLAGRLVTAFAILDGLEAGAGEIFANPLSPQSGPLFLRRPEDARAAGRSSAGGRRMMP
jgi:hypothetical protein